MSSKKEPTKQLKKPNFSINTIPATPPPSITTSMAKKISSLLSALPMTRYLARSQLQSTSPTPRKATTSNLSSSPSTPNSNNRSAVSTSSPTWKKPNPSPTMSISWLWATQKSGGKWAKRPFTATSVSSIATSTPEAPTCGPYCKLEMKGRPIWEGSSAIRYSLNEWFCQFIPFIFFNFLFSYSCAVYFAFYILFI